MRRLADAVEVRRGRRVVEGRRAHLVGIDVHDQERLLELRAARDELAPRVEHDALAVEHQLILSADRVDVRHEEAVPGGTPREHGAALRAPSRRW